MGRRPTLRRRDRDPARTSRRRAPAGRRRRPARRMRRLLPPGRRLRRQLRPHAHLRRRVRHRTTHRALRPLRGLPRHRRQPLAPHQSATRSPTWSQIRSSPVTTTGWQPHAGEDLADRLDPEALLVLVDVGHDQRIWRSGSAAAKNADAVFRISLARRSSVFSRHCCSSSSDSAVVVPGAKPSSMSACLHQPRHVSGRILSCGPIRLQAALTDSPGSRSRDSRTIRLARCLISSLNSSTPARPPPSRGIRASTTPTALRSSSSGGRRLTKGECDEECQDAETSDYVQDDPKWSVEHVRQCSPARNNTLRIRLSPGRDTRERFPWT